MQIKKDYTREQIVEIAKRVFLKNGYAKTSMRDIAKGAGIGVSNIYNYFKSKDELFRHIVGPLITELEQMMHEHHNVNDQDQFVRYARGEGSILLAYPILPLCIIVWLMKLWTASEWYYQGAAEEISIDYAEGLKTLSSSWALALVIILTLAAGYSAIRIVSWLKKA